MCLLLFQDITKLIEGIQKLADLLGINPKLLRYVWWVLVAVLLIWLLTWLKNLLWKNYVKPLRLTPEEKRRLARRQMFANVVEGKIRDIDSNEEWRDNRFTELEAEVEAVGERRVFSLNPFRQRTRGGLRREKSLTKAIEMSRERLIQLEGEPGSGKSVALRFVTRALADRAAKSRDLKRVIPLYLNLKELGRNAGEAVDQSFIRLFVMKSLNKSNDRDVESFLEDEFTRGLEDGTWLFLFDSFDEIPEVLSSTEADEVIKGYADAISDFLGGMNRCRGVVASRHFRGPGQSHWPRFRILSLSESRRLKLIRQALLPPEIEHQLMGHLEMAGPELRDMSANPMLLGLLCEYMKSGSPFPDNVYTVLASYLEHRLSRDEDRVKRRFDVGTGAVRTLAESAAFCMAADVGLGLSPAREDLKRAIRQQGFALGEDDVDKLLDALVFIKLARAADDAKSFTFAHRRFQEYFATRVVLREPDRVSPQELLSDARWRETAVVICQSQPPDALGPILEEARRALAETADRFPDAARIGPANGDPAEVGEADDDSLPDSFFWPSGSLHLLSLLQDGFSRRLKDLPGDLRGNIGEMLLAVYRQAGRFDKKRALEVAGAAPAPALLRLLRKAFTGDSQLLKNVAYWQVARLGEIPDDIADSIRSALLTLVQSGRLWRERLATRAHLARLDKPERFTSSLRLLLALPRVDFLLHALVFAAWLVFTALAGSNGFSRAERVGTNIFLLVFLLISHLSFRLLRLVRVLAGRLAEFVIAYLRFITAVMLLIPPVAVVAEGDASGSSSFLFLYAIFCTYAILWLPSSLIAARVGQCTSLIWWPFMPFVPPLLFLRNIRAILTWAKKSKKGLAATALLLLFPVAFALMGDKFGGLANYFTLALTLLGICMIGVNGYSWLRDRARWYTKARSYLQPISGPLFRGEFDKYRSAPFRLRFVSTVRSRGQLEATRQADELIEELALSLERELIKRKRRGILRSVSMKEIFSLNSAPTAELIDELTMLLEQVRANRRDGATQGQASAPAPAATVGPVRV